MVLKFLSAIITASGYKNASHFVDSTFHPDFVTQATALSGTLALIAYYFHAVFGFQLPVGAVIIILFFLEMYTGIQASKKKGHGWESEQFGKGWLKLAVYWILIGCTNIIAIYAKAPNILGYPIDIYSFIHFAWLNFVLLQLLGSNIENCIELGWDKKSILVRLLAKIYNIKAKDDGRTD